MFDRYRQLTCAFIVLVGLLAPATRAFSIDVDAKLGLQATVGLDPNTINMINGLPAEIKNQMLDLLKQALPLIDQSVQSYIKTINDDINADIDNLQCTLVGTGAALVGVTKSSLPFAGPYEPVEDLKKDQAKVTSSFSVNENPAGYVSVYEDLIVRATITACAVKPAIEAFADVNKVQQDTRFRWSAWSRLAASKCTDAFACYDWLHDDVAHFIDTHDKRDVDQVHGADRLKAVVKPEKPGLFGGWSPTAIEISLNEMFSIEDGITAAGVIRENIARQYIEDAQSQVSNDEMLVGSAQAALSQSVKNDKVRATLVAVQQSDSSIASDLAQAAEFTLLRKDDVAGLQRRLYAVHAQEKNILDAATKYDQAIDEAARQRAAAQNAIIQNRAQGGPGGR